MENNNKMKNLTNDLKAFEKMRKDQRKETQNPGVEIEIGIDPEEESPEDILLQAAGMLMDCSVMVAKAAFLVGLMETDTEDDEENEDEDGCGNCPYDGDCGRYGTMVLVVRPDGDNTIMTLDELIEEIGEVFNGPSGACDMKPIPGTEDLYYTITEKKPLKRGDKTYFRGPAVIFGVDEDAGEVVSPYARQLYAAARYFEEHSTRIKTREGEVSAFCFD